MDLHDKSPYKARKKSLPFLEAVKAYLEEFKVESKAAPPGSNVSLTGHPRDGPGGWEPISGFHRSPVHGSSQPSHQDSSVGKMDLHDKPPDKARKISLKDMLEFFKPMATIKHWVCKVINTMAEKYLFKQYTNYKSPPGSNDSLTGHPTVKAQPFDKQYTHYKSPPSDVGCTSQPNHQDSSVGQQSNVHLANPSLIDDFAIPEAAAVIGSVIGSIDFKITYTRGREYVASNLKLGGKVFKALQCKSFPHRKLELLDDTGKPVGMLYFHNLKNQCDVRIYSVSNMKKEFSISRDHNESYVNLLNNSSGGNCYYKVTENRTDDCCTIYKGNSSTIIAQTRPHEGNTFMLKINLGEDLSLMFSITVAVYAMRSPSKRRDVARFAANIATKIAGGAAFGAGKVLFDGVTAGLGGF